MKRKILALGLAVTVFCASGITSFASDGATVTFKSDSTLEYDTSGTGFTDAFKDVAPGEEKKLVIEVKNDNSRTADFYINAAAIEALEQDEEKARAAGYDIKLEAGGSVLYDSTLGGYQGAGTVGAGGEKGILGMNDSLEDSILFATLPQNGTSQVIFTIKFDGEAMDNDVYNLDGIDYSDTSGVVAFGFQVRYEDPTGQTVIVREVGEDGQVRYVRKVVEIFENAVPLGAVATGDGAMIGVAAVVLLVGASMVILGRKKKQEE